MGGPQWCTGGKTGVCVCVFMCVCVCACVCLCVCVCVVCVCACVVYICGGTFEHVRVWVHV